MNNNRNNYSYAPTYGAPKKVAPQKKNSSDRQGSPQPPAQQQPYGQQPYPPQPGGTIPPGYSSPSSTQQGYPSYTNQHPTAQQPFYQGQQPSVPNQWNTQAQTHQPYSTGSYNQPAPQQFQADQQNYYGQQPVYNNSYSSPQAGQGSLYDSPVPYYTGNPNESMTPPASTPYGNPQNSDYYAQPVSQPAPSPSYESTQREPRVESDKEIIEKVLQGLLFVVLPVLFLGSLFISAPFIKWAFIILCFISLTMMWAKKSFLSSARTILTLIYVALSAVTVVTMLVGAPATNNTSNNPSGLGGSLQSPYVEPNPSPTPDQNQGNISIVDENQTGADNPSAQATAPPLGASQAEQRLSAFFNAWMQNDNAAMLQLTSPKWRNGVADLELSLLSLTGTKTVTGYNIIEAGGSDSESIRTIIAQITTTSLSSDVKEYQYSVMMMKENDEWYVDPTSFKSFSSTPAPSVAAVQTQAPDNSNQSQNNSQNAGTRLYYNADGGSFYHAVEDCSTVGKKFLPLTAFSFESLNTEPYSKLKPCTSCKPPSR